MLISLEQMQGQSLEALENIKDPEQIEKAIQTENVEKFIDHSKQAKN